MDMTFTFWGEQYRTPGYSLCPCPHPLLQKRKNITKLRGPNPKSSRTALQSKSVRSPSQKGALGWGDSRCLEWHGRDH